MTRRASQLFKNDEISKLDYPILSAICDRFNPKTGCFPSISTIARDSKSSESTVKRALRRLKNQKVIKIEKIKGKQGLAHNSYLFLAPFFTYADMAETATLSTIPTTFNSKSRDPNAVAKLDQALKTSGVTKINHG